MEECSPLTDFLPARLQSRRRFMHGKALVVDLTTKRTQEQEVPQKYYDQYIGGRGLGGRLLHDLMDPKADPLGPENVLMFVSGPLNPILAFYSSTSVVLPH